MGMDKVGAGASGHSMSGADMKEISNEQNQAEISTGSEKLLGEVNDAVNEGHKIESSGGENMDTVSLSSNATDPSNQNGTDGGDAKENAKEKRHEQVAGIHAKAGHLSNIAQSTKIDGASDRNLEEISNKVDTRL